MSTEVKQNENVKATNVKNESSKKNQNSLSIREKMIEKKKEFDKYSRPLLKVSTAINAIEYLVTQPALDSDKEFLQTTLEKLNLIQTTLEIEAEKYI